VAGGPAHPTQERNQQGGKIQIIQEQPGLNRIARLQ
jgi:hypothetical protein